MQIKKDDNNTWMESSVHGHVTLTYYKQRLTIKFCKGNASSITHEHGFWTSHVLVLLQTNNWTTFTFQPNIFSFVCLPYLFLYFFPLYCNPFIRQLHFHRILKIMERWNTISQLCKLGTIAIMEFLDMKEKLF